MHKVMRESTWGPIIGSGETTYGILETSVTINSVLYHIFSTRFDHANAGDRKAGMEQGAKMVSKLVPSAVVIFGGDFNEHPTTPNLALFQMFSGLTDAFAKRPDPDACGGGGGIDDFDYVDYIFFRGPYRVADVRLRCPWPGLESVSDHPWIVVELVPREFDVRLAAGQNADGRLEVLYIGTDDVLYHNWRSSPNGGWAGESVLDTSSNKGKALAVAQNADGRLEVLYIGTDNVLYHNWRSSPNGGWAGESVLDTSSNKGKALAVAQNADGRLEVFYIGTDDVLYHNWQSSPNGGWVGESVLDTSSNKGKALAVAQNADGRLEVFYIGTDDVLYHNWQSSPNGGWVGESVLDTSSNKGKALAVAQNADGRLEVLYIGTD